MFELSGNTLRDTGHRIKVRGGSAALRTAEKSTQADVSTRTLNAGRVPVA